MPADTTLLELDLVDDAEAREAMYRYAKRIEGDRPDRARAIFRAVGRHSTAEEVRRRHADDDMETKTAAIRAGWPEKLADPKPEDELDDE